MKERLSYSLPTRRMLVEDEKPIVIAVKWQWNKQV